MDLYITGISKSSTFFVCLPGSTYIGSHCHGRQEEYIAISTGCKNYSMCTVSLCFSGNDISYNNTPCLAINEDQVQDFQTRIHRNVGETHLPALCLVGAQKQLLTGLSPGIKCSGDECSTERTIVEHPSIFSCKGNTLGNTLVNDIVTYFRQSVHICLSGPVVTTFYCIVEQTVDTVAIIGIVFCCIDTALGSNTVCSSWTVLVTEGFYLKAHFGE